MLKKTLLYASVSLLTLSASAMFDEHYLEESKSSHKNGFHASFEAPIKYTPSNPSKLTHEDVVALIHEGTFDYDNPQEATYLRLLSDPNDEMELYCYEGLRSHYASINNQKLVEQINKILFAK